MTYIYRCHLTLLEPTFFSSREIGNYFQTEPLIGNYALAYALGFVASPYFNDGTIHYAEHLGQLNERGVYTTPATLIHPPRFSLAQFNAQPDSYWYAMANNTIVTRPDGTMTEKRGSKWYVKQNRADRGKAVGLENRPQHGRIRFLSIGNEAVFYILSAEACVVPRYIRLGKFMSKAKVVATELDSVEIEGRNVYIPFLLNPADLGLQSEMTTFNLINVPPVPLVEHSTMNGSFYQLPDRSHLPMGMRFGVQGL